jgi:hypothetical protein
VAARAAAEPVLSVHISARPTLLLEAPYERLGAEQAFELNSQALAFFAGQRS